LSVIVQTALDVTDIALLSRLQENARQSLDSLAEAAQISVASVQRRLKRLREAGVIEREVAIIDPAAVGQTMTFIVMVELERERPDQIDAFARLVQGEPRVQQCYYVTGEADFCLICTAANMTDFEDLSRRLFFDQANVRRFRTSVVMGRRKVGLSIGLPRVREG